MMLKHYCATNSKWLFAILLCLLSLHGWSDYTQAEKKLNKMEEAKLEKLISKKLPWFQFDSAVVTGTDRDLLSLTLSSRPRAGKYCRYCSISIAVNRKLKNIKDIQRIAYFFGLPDSESCTSGKINYIETGEVPFPDFLVEYFLKWEPGILNQIDLVQKHRNQDLVLTRLYFTNYGASVLVGMQWNAENSSFSLDAFVDVEEHNPIVVKFGGGDRI